MKINERIRRIRQIQGLSQEDVAMRLEMSANGYGGIERGDVDIKLSRLEQISELFGIDVAELLTLSEKNTFNLISDSGTQNTGILNHFNIHESIEAVELKHEIDKLKLIIDKLEYSVKTQQTEISYLKNIIDLMKV